MLAWSLWATGAPLVWTVLLGRGGHDHPHGTGVLWGAIAALGLVTLWLASLALRLRRRDGQVRRRAAFAVAVAAVLTLLPPYTLSGLVIAGVFVPLAAIVLWRARRALLNL